MSDVQFSYADPAFSVAKRAFIRAVEGVTSQPRLKRLNLENHYRPMPGETFFAAAVRYSRSAGKRTGRRADPEKTPPGPR
jgi:hypothetical protein